MKNIAQMMLALALCCLPLWHAGAEALPKGEVLAAEEPAESFIEADEAVVSEAFESAIAEVEALPLDMALESEDEAQDPNAGVEVEESLPNNAEVAEDEGALKSSASPLLIEGTVVKSCDTSAQGKVVIPEGITEIGPYAFMNCAGVTEVVIPESVTRINQMAFQNSGLRSVRIPSGVVFGDDDFQIFSGCAQLQSVVLAEGLKESPEFNGCTALTQVSVPDSLEALGSFANCVSLEHIDLKHIRRMGSFEGCSKLRDLTLPNTLEAIGDRAFSGCTSLTEMEFPASITHIGARAFENCTGLKTITVHCTIRSDGLYYDPVFIGCDIETAYVDAAVVAAAPGRKFGYEGNVIVVGNLEAVPERAFANWSMKSVTLPNTVRSIGKSAFERTNVSTVILQNGLQSIGEKAFYLSGLTAIDIPGSVTTLGVEAFAECKSLENVRIGDGVKVISQKAFNECTKLSSLTLPDSVTTLGNCCFQECERLQTLRLSQNLTAIPPSAFVRCDIRALDVPPSVKILQYDAFGGNRNLAQITLHDGLETVEMYAFTATAIRELYLPKTVLEFSGWALAQCPNLTTVHVLGMPVFEGQNLRDSWHTFRIVNSAKPKKLTVTSATGKRLALGETDQLGVTFSPANAYSTIKWKSSNAKVAAVDANGLVTPKKAGNVTITATAKRNKVKATFKLTVFDPKAATSVKLQAKSATLAPEMTFTLVPTALPATAVTGFMFSSSKSSVASVDQSGVVTGRKVGTATITVKTDNGKKATCKVTVKAAPKEITVTADKAVIGVGETTRVHAKLTNKSYPEVTWSATGAAKVDAEGNITGVTPGSVTVTGRTINGLTASVTVTVLPAPERFTLNKTALTLKKGKSDTLKVILPEGTAASCAFVSSNPKVASVNASGKITGKKKGTAQITVTLSNGLTQACTVTVK